MIYLYLYLLISAAVGLALSGVAMIEDGSYKEILGAFLLGLLWPVYVILSVLG